jgi:RecJ-like exonuclease
MCEECDGEGYLSRTERCGECAGSGECVACFEQRMAKTDPTAAEIRDARSYPDDLDRRNF